jgi:hypothetical protein
VAISDFNNDGFSDIQWYNAATREVGYWTIANGAIAAWTQQADFPTNEWGKIGNGDYDADGFSDTLWFGFPSTEVGWWNTDAGKRASPPSHLVDSAAFREDAPPSSAGGFHGHLRFQQ